MLQGRVNNAARDAYQTQVQSNPNAYGSVARYQPYQASDADWVQRMMRADGVGVLTPGMSAEDYYYHMGSANQQAERAQDPTWQNIEAQRRAIFGG